MKPTDLEEVLAIEEASFSTPWSRAAFERLLRKSGAGALVAEAGTAVVGYALYWTVADEAELGNLAVRPDVRRRGVGRRLVRAVEEAARQSGAEALYLEVRESNEGARALYGELGFRNVARRRGYYRSPAEDALVLRRELGEPTRPQSAREPER